MYNGYKAHSMYSITVSVFVYSESQLTFHNLFCSDSNSSWGNKENKVLQYANFYTFSRAQLNWRLYLDLTLKILWYLNDPGWRTQIIKTRQIIYDKRGSTRIKIVNRVICEGILINIFLTIVPASVISSAGRMSPKPTAESLTNSK